MKKSSREELGNFLKSRRARLLPEDVGLTRYGRRRNKGLKREEVAQLAGVSLSWYTWIEQGREINFSVEVLSSILQVLQLSTSEKRYVFTLCGLQYTPTESDLCLSPFTRQLIDHQGDYPAYIVNHYWDILHLNNAAAQLFVGFDSLPPDRQNMLWYMFTYPNCRTLVVDWELHAQRTVAEFRADSLTFLNDPYLVTFVKELCQHSAEFTHWWDNYDVHFSEGALKTFDHPTLGIKTFHQQVLKVAKPDDMRLIVYIPATDEQ